MARRIREEVCAFVRADCKDAAQVRRENKLALIVGFSVLLVVAVLVSDHLSRAAREEVRDGLDTLAKLPEEGVFFETPLSAGQRATGTEPEPIAAEPAPRPATPQPVRTADAGTPPAGQTAEVAPGGVLPATPRIDEPVIVTNGPSANRLARSGGSNQGTRSDLFGIDPSKIRALLETARNGASTSAAEPGSGLVAAARKYVVQPGDTLYEICQRLYGDGERWPELAARNKGKVGSNGTVYVGVTLDLMPGVRDAALEARTNAHPGAHKAAPKPPTARSGHTRKYVVKKGDTLSQIAQREVGSIRFLGEIRKLNPSLKKNHDRIFVGQTLVLPAPRG